MLQICNTGFINYIVYFDFLLHKLRRPQRVLLKYQSHQIPRGYLLPVESFLQSHQGQLQKYLN